MLMLIGKSSVDMLRLNIISIHLMLMLIANRRQQSQQIIYFNTSHVNVNPDVMKLAAVTRGHFNTSHVNVNRIMALIMKWCSHISIHLMLMLILNAITYNSNYRNFNTSHVNVNQVRLCLYC